MRARIGDAMALAAVALVAVAVSVAVVAGFVAAVVVAVVGVGFLLVNRLGLALASDVDRSWLPYLLPVAFLVKMLGSAARYAMIAVYYGYGDAFGYHNTGVRIAPVWRSLRVPEVSGGSFSTAVTKQITGLVYAVVTPDMLGGFMMFGVLSFVGMVCFYLAFRRVMPAWAVGPYFALLFFLPTLVFWPSSVGKDALMILALGVASLGAARAFGGRIAVGLATVGAGILLAVLVRPHVAVIAVGAMVLAVLLSRTERLGLGRATQIAVVVVAAVALVYIVPIASARIGLQSGNIDAFLQEQQRRTAQGGSVVVGSPVTSPLDLPEATLRVLFRPLPYEARTPATLATALEGFALLGLVVWRLPTVWANRRVVRSSPYLLYALGFTFAFVVAFSAIFNFGILARQRSQVMPYLIAVVVGLGWRRWEERDAVQTAPSGEEISA